MGWAAHFPEKMKVVDCCMPKSQYDYNWASMWFFVNHGRRVLTTSVLIALFEALDDVCYH